MSSRDDEELAVLLADLERTLADLREAVGEDVRRGSGDRPPRRRPPTPGEILRFTEEYTLPTVIALLEATTQSLELLRAVLRLAGPASNAGELRSRLASRDGPETAALRDALGDLRDALTGADLPEDSAARSILTDARALTTEIDERLDEERDDRNRERRTDRERAPSGRGVAIDVEEEGDDGVDVDEELASIKESVGEESGDDPDGSTE
jgi:hypothetical protein